MAMQKPVVLMPMEKAPLIKLLNQKLQLGITLETLTTPTADLAQKMYRTFVRQILNVSESCLSTLPLSADCDHDPELHRNSIPIIIVYQCMKAFIKDHSGDKLDLTMCDLIQPHRVPGRFKKMATFLADYMRFHEIGNPVFNEISEEFSYQKQEVEMLHIELQNEESRKNGLLANQNLRKRREHELINEHNKVKTEFGNMVAQYEASHAAAEALNKEKEEALEETDRMEMEIISGKKMVDHLKEEVLSSPEELKVEMANRKKLIEELKDNLKATKKSYTERMEAIEICASFEKNKLMIEEKFRQFAMVKDEIMELLDAENENQRKLDDMEVEHRYMVEQRKNMHELLEEKALNHAQLRKEHLQRNEELNKKIEEITKKIAALGKNQPDVSRDIEKKRQELLAVKNCNSEIVAKAEHETREKLAKFQKVQTAFLKVHRNAEEKKTACERRISRVVNASVGRFSDHTFSTSSINEDSENTAPDSLQFNVFK